jgi:PII-like signaling protein
MITIATGVAAAGGGYVSGRQVNRVQKETIESQIAGIEALRVRIDEQDRRLQEIPQLNERISILTEMVTQRANVDRVIEIVTEIKEKLDGS